VNDIVIIIPTLNEKDNINILFEKLKETNIASDILFIDDNSSDGTQELIKKHHRKCN